MKNYSILDELAAETDALEIQSRVRDIQTVISIPSNATNGDVIKILFPYVKIFDELPYSEKLHGSIIHTNIDGLATAFLKEWWNKSYKIESEVNE